MAVTINDDSVVSKYQFGTKTADFYVCTSCGVVPFVLSEIDDNLYAVVNINTIADVSRFSLSSSATDFDGEETGSRLDRRRRNWIPDVSIS